MKFIHLSDIHLTAPGERMGGLDPHSRFRRALEHANTHHADAVRIIITGDLTHWGEHAAYVTLSEALRGQTLPVRLLIGNHDDRSAFLRVFNDHPRDGSGYINHAETIEGQRFIYCDTVLEHTHAGHFGADRLLWLEAELSGASRARLFFHHNPMPVGLPAEDQIALIPEDRDALRMVLVRFADRIDYIHFGHVHAPIHGTYCGIPFSSVPSTGNQAFPDLDEQTLIKGAPLDPAYFVVQVESGQTIIHHIPYTWDGPIFSSGVDWEDWAKPTAGAAE